MPDGTHSMSTAHAIVMANTDGHIVHWNDEAQRLFGYTPDEALGQSLDLIVPPAFRDRHWAGFHKAIATGICSLDRATTNVPVRCKDGVVQPFPARFVFLQAPRGEVVGVIGLYSERAGSETPFGPIVPS